jgi:hypothetical protein
MPDPSASETLRAMAKAYPLKVLVWGPGDPGAGASEEVRKGYEKRLQIKEQIQTNFPNATVRFSEDPEMQEMGYPGMTKLEQETEHAYWADLIVSLFISRGAYFELDYMIPAFSWIRDKVYLLLPDRYVSTEGFIKELYNFLRPVQIKGYTDEEYRICKVATERSLEIAGIRATMLVLKS